MLAVHGIACDDTINKYNERIPLSTMIDMYKKQWSDRFPFSVNHDHTKTIGYSRIDGVYFDPSRAVVVTSSFIPENEEELKQMKALLSVKPKNEEQYKSLHAELSNYIIGNVTYYSIDSVSLRNEGIVYRVFPEIKAQVDDDGLIDISFLDTVSPGIYKVGKYLIYGHRYFRRNLSLLNTLNDPFFSDLEQYKLLHPEASVKIRIDPDLIGLAGTESKRREYAYWWGPLFSEDLSAIPLGLSHFENDQYDALTSPIRFTECGWYIQDGRKTFECEEVCDSENIVLPEEVLSGCRYVHSMMDSNSTIVHFDGAIRGYSMEKMLDRLSQRMTEVKKDTVYTKLWRIDGDVPVLIWKKLITQYYRDNHMIGEYLGGKEKQQPPEIIEKKQEDTTAKLSTEHYIPVDLSMDDGIRVFFSMRKPISIGDSNVAILPILNKADNGLPDIYIESFARTFGKMLSRKGLIARMPISPELLFYNDMNINLPYLICDTRKTMGLVLECINEFCKAWEKDKQDRQLSFTIGKRIINTR
ncbi:MAG: hypothetical protein IKF90_08510 [Parasporobacterium sp.]|nr:hypothetical protein [Parasporobacterium sp.]